MSNQKVYMTAAPSALNRPNELEPRQRSSSAQTSRQSVSPNPPPCLYPPLRHVLRKLLHVARVWGK